MRKENLVYNCLVSIVEKLIQLNEKIDGILALSPGLFDHMDVCRVFRISRRTLDHYREQGLIPYIRIGGRIYYRLADINRCIDENTVCEGRRLEQENKEGPEQKSSKINLIK